MWWQGDPATWATVAEERWNGEREAAAQRRLIHGQTVTESVPITIRWAHQVVEHMYYYLSARVAAPVHREREIESMSDIEIAHLLALLTPEGDVLRVERVRRVPEREEEYRASGY